MSVVRLADCYVRRLALYGAAAADNASRSAHLIEDALRTASVHAGARVLVVRALKVGRITASTAAATVALRMEDRLRELATHAVSVRDSSAVNADAVYFDDPLHALAELAGRLAAHRRADEWFWPLAVPAWRPDLPRADALRAIVMASFDAGAGVSGPAAVVHAIARSGGLDELISALRWQDGLELMRRSGWSEQRVHDWARADRAVRSNLTLTAPSERVVRAWTWRLGPDDARVTWLSALLAIAERPTRAADRQLPTRANAYVHELLRDRQRSAVAAAEPEAEREAQIAEAARAVGTTPRPPQPEPSATQAEKRPEKSQAKTSLTRTSASPAQAGDRPARREPVQRAEPQQRRRMEMAEEKQPPARAQDAALPTEEAASADSNAAMYEAVPSAYAGLFYLLPLMQRLDAEQWLQQHPELFELQFVTRLLRHVAARVGAPADDPVFAALYVEPLADVTALEPQLREWTRSLRRWCHRHAQIGLVALVKRTGSIAWTRTHLDVHFRLRQIDMRVRKAGLDVDPGWLPWFGRVVMFHYEREESRLG